MGTGHLRVVTAYLRSLEAVSRKRILYHGTSPEVGRRVLSEGLVPDPKKRSWEDDPGTSFNELSKKSFPGTYLTGNIMTALSAASRVSPPPRPRAIVVVEVEESQLVHDEDTLKSPLRYVLIDLAKERGVIYVERSALSMYDEMVDGKLDKVLKDKSVGLLQSIDSRAKQGYGLERATMIERALRALLTRDTAVGLQNTVWYGKDKTWDNLKETVSLEGYNLEGLPEPAEAERLFMIALEEMSNKLKPTTAAGLAADRFSAVSRMRSPIGFSGANKIVAVMLIDTEDYSIKFLYGSPSDARLKDFFKEYSERMTSNFDVFDSSGKSVLETLKTHGIPVEEDNV